ncbi:MAG: hypothetical protein Q7T82_08360 [Armatimonadota bacterium]|nr:hypothetical protein [Armatimonadota bacterium]
MQKRTCCLTLLFVLVGAMLVIGFFTWRCFGRYERVYAGIRNGMAEKQVRARYAPYKAFIDKAPIRRWDPYVKARGARNGLAIDPPGFSLVYVYYLDSHDRVVYKYRFLD